jgi:hypothetical protein
LETSQQLHRPSQIQCVDIEYFEVVVTFEHYPQQTIVSKLGLPID